MKGLGPPRPSVVGCSPGLASVGFTFPRLGFDFELLQATTILTTDATVAARHLQMVVKVGSLVLARYSDVAMGATTVSPAAAWCCQWAALPQQTTSDGLNHNLFVPIPPRLLCLGDWTISIECFDAQVGDTFTDALLWYLPLGPQKLV